MYYVEKYGSRLNSSNDFNNLTAYGMPIMACNLISYNEIVDPDKD